MRENSNGAWAVNCHHNSFFLSEWSFILLHIPLALGISYLNCALLPWFLAGINNSCSHYLFPQQNYTNMNSPIQLILKTNCIELLASPLSDTILLTIQTMETIQNMESSNIQLKHWIKLVKKKTCFHMNMSFPYLYSFSASIAMVWFRLSSPLN